MNTDVIQVEFIPTFTLPSVLDRLLTLFYLYSLINVKSSGDGSIPRKTTRMDILSTAFSRYGLSVPSADGYGALRMAMIAVVCRIVDNRSVIPTHRTVVMPSGRFIAGFVSAA
jgi:hypothetical protein